MENVMHAYTEAQIKSYDQTYHVSCNGHARELRALYEMPESARGEFDYVTDDDRLSPRFVQYRGSWYDVHEFTSAPDSVKALGYDGIQPQSYFDTVAIRFFDRDGHLIDGGDSVIVAHIHW